MNLEKFPRSITEDIEDQSLKILKEISDLFVVIGGWAVRSIVGDEHGRYTLDIDGVAKPDDIDKIKEKLIELGMDVRMNDWGIQFYTKYSPSVEIDEEFRDVIEEIELRIEISEPVIRESLTHHYFEFKLDEYEERIIRFHEGDEVLKIKVPPIEHMTAVKMGLPVDYKNNYDSQILLQNSNVDRVIEIIKSNDDWDQMVIRRIPKLIGKIMDKDRTENILARNNNIDIKENVKKMRYIKEKLMEEE